MASEAAAPTRHEGAGVARRAASRAVAGGACGAGGGYMRNPQGFPGPARRPHLWRQRGLAPVGAGPVGPGVAMTTGASSSRKASTMWGAIVNANLQEGY